MWQKIKSWIVQKLSEWVLRFEVQKLKPTLEDVVFIYYSKNMTFIEVNKFIENMSKKFDNNSQPIFFISDEYRVDTLNIKSDDMIRIEVPISKFHMWQSSGTLTSEGKELKRVFVEQGIQNKLIILPDGYTYKVSDVNEIKAHVEVNNE